jgi:LysM repeat protein
MASRRSPARWLAPIAVLACAFAVYTVVHKGLDESTSSSTTSSKQATKATAGDGKPTRKKHRHRYVVKSGDTLSAISAKTGVPLETIQRLNPDLDAQSLHAGEKVKLRP